MAQYNATDSDGSQHSRWQAAWHYHADTSPWLLADLEDATALLGADWQPYGVAPNRTMIAALCAEQLAPGLIAAPTDPEMVFADFERVARGETSP